jgi:hypothetical protein
MVHPDIVLIVSFHSAIQAMSAVCMGALPLRYLKVAQQAQELNLRTSPSRNEVTHRYGTRWLRKQVSEDGEIKSIKFNDYISFVLSAESANDESFKDFRNAVQME